ncbi:hypothetical protein [Geotalea uraniireducens]|nr:hypothetical protein [Geotalea uraniireducens]
MIVGVAYISADALDVALKDAFPKTLKELKTMGIPLGLQHR